MDAQKRHHQRKPKCYSTTPSNLTMIDADECDDIFEPLNFSTKDLVNIFADTDFLHQPEYQDAQSSSPVWSRAFATCRREGEECSITEHSSYCKTVREGEEYSAMSPCKSVSSSVSKPQYHLKSTLILLNPSKRVRALLHLCMVGKVLQYQKEAHASTALRKTNLFVHARSLLHLLIPFQKTAKILLKRSFKQFIPALKNYRHQTLLLP